MRIAFTLFFILFSCQSLGQTQQFTLNNGLKVLVKEDHRAPVVVSMIWYNVGSADEPGGITGISHVLEHMMFKGTPKHPQGTFTNIIATLGGQDNAFTNNDYTAFYEKLSASQLAVSFELESDRMQHLLFDNNEFAKEMQVIQEERRLRTDDVPQALTFERFLATAHLAAPYQHPVIGWMSDLKQMSVQDAKTWYQRYYAPNNATIVVIGDVDPKTVHQLAKQYFEKIKKHTLIQRKLQKEPRRLGKKIVHIHVPAQVPMIMLGFTVPTVKSASPENTIDPYVLEVIGGILSAGDSGRFTSQLIGKKEVASDVDVFYNLYARYESQFILFGTPSKTHTLLDLKKGLLDEISRLQKEPVSEKELQRVKTQIIAQKTFEKDSIFSQAMELGILETVGLGWQTADKYVERINSITPQLIQKIAQHYFQENNLTEAQLLPTTVSGKQP